MHKEPNPQLFQQGPIAQKHADHALLILKRNVASPVGLVDLARRVCDFKDQEEHVSPHTPRELLPLLSRPIGEGVAQRLPKTGDQVIDTVDFIDGVGAVPGDVRMGCGLENAGNLIDRTVIQSLPQVPDDFFVVLIDCAHVIF